jgi:hypothetical protein
MDQHMSDRVGGNQKKRYALEARGRNGVFSPRRAYVFKDGDFASLSIASNRLGLREPIELMGNRQALTDVVRRLYEALTREGEGELLTIYIPSGIPKVEESKKYGMRFVRTKSKYKINP